MRSGYLVLLAAALQLGVTSAGPTISAIKAEAWGQCGSGAGVTAQCPEGYRCDPVNETYDQCVPNSYPPAPKKSASKREAAVDANSTPEVAPSADLEKRQTSNTPIVGAKSASGKCYQRRKIQTLQASYPDQFNMLLLALEDLQKQPETLDVSWFGIAGIHGAPYTVWQQPTTGTYNTRLGYCVHGSPTFATWHRPYTILMEQVLQGRAVAIAARFTGTKATAYKTAADQLRLPYWDWSDPVTQSSIPAVVMQSTISVTRPGTNGVPVAQTIKNPLFSYSFQNPSALANYFSGNYARWPNTTRQPRSNSDPTPNNANASQMMQNGFSVRKQQTFQLYNFKSFNAMASQLEGIHNGIHTTIGGSNPLGHMSVTNVAAFDPIFWLHHCNVDRLTVLYQAIYPANQLQPANAVATFARIVPGTDGPQDTMSTKLYPFKMSGGSYWTSNEIKSAGTIWKYKYGYDEIPCESNGKVTAQQLSQSVLARVNALYGPTTTGSTKKSRRSPEALAAPEPEAAAGPMAYAYPEPKRYSYQPGWTPKKGKRVTVRNDYTVRCMIDHSELPGSWTAHILFTDTPCGETYSPSEYFLSRDRIAGFSSFGAPYVRKASMAYSQEFPITEDLISRGVKISDPRKTEKWLNDNLKICFTTGDDQLYEIPAASLKTYKVGVYRQETKYPEGLKHGSTLPSYGDKKYMVGATKGMPGGIKDKKEMEYPIMLDGRIEDLEGDKDTY